MTSGALTLDVVFDDGPTVTVEIKTRDIARLEELDPGFAEDGKSTPKRMVLAAWLALQRMSRQGTLPEGVTLPGSLDEFLDIADVEGGLDPKASEPSPEEASTTQ